jgi:cytoskeletal protein CcmA (bactofilin family)
VQRSVVRDLMSIALVPWCLSIGVVSAAESRAEPQLLIAADEVIEDDLYLFGDEITIDGQVNGDVCAFGRLIRMNGTVEGDFMAAGRAIVISGKVGDDVRMAGQVLKIDDDANIADDVMAAGFSLEAADGSSIDGDLLYGGYQALLAGRVGGKVIGGLANCEISGNIGKDVHLGVGGDQTGPIAYTAGSPPPIAIPNVPPGLTIRDTVKIDGDLEYESSSEADIAAGAKIAGEIRHKLPDVETTLPPTLAQKMLSVFGRYAALLVVGVGVLLVAPNWMRGMSDGVKTRPIASLGLGVAGIAGFIVLLIVIFVAVIVLAVISAAVKLTGLVPVVIVLGLTAGAVTVVSFWFFTVYLADIVLSFFAGSWLLNLAKPTMGENRFFALLVGLVLLALISSVPYLGSIVGWLVVLFGLGALVGWLFWRRPQILNE